MAKNKKGKIQKPKAPSLMTYPAPVNDGSFGNLLASVGGDTPFNVAKIPQSIHLPTVYTRTERQLRNDIANHSVLDPEARRALDYKQELTSGKINISPQLDGDRLGWTTEQVVKFRSDMITLFDEVCESNDNSVDLNRRHTASGVARQHTRLFQGLGEAIAQVVKLPANNNSPLTFAIRDIARDRIRNPMNNQRLQNEIRDGFLMSRNGTPLAAYVHRYSKGDRFRASNQLNGSTTRGDDADRFSLVRMRDTEGRINLVHSYRQILSDLVRGMSKLAPVLCLAEQRDRYRDSALEDAISKAGLTFIIKSLTNNVGDVFSLLSGEDGELTGLDGKSYKDKMSKLMADSSAWHKQQGTGESQKNGNLILRLLHGEEVDGFSSEAMATFEAFNTALDRISAAVHDMPLEEYRQQHTGNFSAARAGKLYLWHMIRADQRDSTYKIMDVIYERSMEDFISSGMLQVPNFENSPTRAVDFFLRNRKALTRVEYFGSEQDDIDRSKQIDFHLGEKELGTHTFETTASQLHGQHWEDRVRQSVNEVKFSYDYIESVFGETPSTPAHEVAAARLFGGNATSAREMLRNNQAPVQNESDESGDESGDETNENQPTE